MNKAECFCNSGIYKITNIITKKVYIGSSVNLKKRRLEHFRKLREGSHRNPHLQSSFDKYGENSFKYEIILYCIPEECIKEEQRAMDWFRSANIELYNICPLAGSRFGKHPSQETKDKISKTLTGRKNPFTPEHCKNISIGKSK